MSYPYQIKSLEEYNSAYKKSIKEPEQFWGDIAENFLWKKKWDKALEWNFKEPKVEWFKGAKLNITENCIDRHLKELGDKPAIIWEPNNPEERTRIVTYSRLHKRVCQFAQVLINNGVKKVIVFVFTWEWFLNSHMQFWVVQESALFTALSSEAFLLKVLLTGCLMHRQNSLLPAMAHTVAAKTFP